MSKPAEAPIPHHLETLAKIKETSLDTVVEMTIFEAVILAAIHHGCTISLQDGLSAAEGAEVTVEDSTNAKALIEASRTTDADVLILRGPIRGWIAFVWGNGSDVIHDHSASPDLDRFVKAFEPLLEMMP